jgi:hypothetical protein
MARQQRAIAGVLLLFIENSFAEDPDRERKARQDLYPYLAASKLYAEWDWKTQVGLVRRKGRPVEPKLRYFQK